MQDEKLPVLTGLILDETTTLTLDELSYACSVRIERIVELVDEGILEPVGRDLMNGVSRAPAWDAPASPCICSGTWASILPVWPWCWTCWMNSNPCAPNCGDSNPGPDDMQADTPAGDRWRSITEERKP